MNPQDILCKRTRLMHEAVARDLIQACFRHPPGFQPTLVTFDPQHPGSEIPPELRGTRRRLTVELGTVYGAYSIHGDLAVELALEGEFKLFRVPFAAMARIEVPRHGFIMTMPAIQRAVLPEANAVPDNVVSLAGRRANQTAL